MKRKNPILILSVLAVVSLLGLGLLGRTNHRVEKLRKSSLRARIKSVSYVDSLKSPSGNDSEPQSLMVKLKPVLSGMDVKTLFQSTGFAEIEPLYDNVYRFQGKDSLVPLNDLMEQLRNNPAVELVEKDVVVRAMDAPNDPYFLYQFYLYNHGQTLNLTDGTVVQPKSGADINVVDARTFSKGSEEVKIGVLDSGADYNHPDLRNKLDAGFNFVGNNAYPIDDNGHGTAMAGIIGASTNNGQGIAGICWNCRLIPYKVLGADGKGNYSNLVLAIRRAVDEGCKVINMSLGADEPSIILEDALKYAYEKDVVILAATGNEGKGSVCYPARYSSYVLAVAATDENDLHASFSNHGPEVAVAAPGHMIMTTFPNGQYALVTGTSPATAVASGVVGLIRSLKPFLTAEEIFKILKYGSDDVNKALFPGIDIYLGWGRLNANTYVAPIKVE